jgi:diguanylate cyclase
MPTTIDSLEQLRRERERFDKLRRQVFVVAGLLGVLLIIISTIDQVMHPGVEAIWWLFLGNDIVFGIFTTCAVVLAASRRVAQETIERITLGVFAVESLLFNGIIAGLADPSLAALFSETVGDDIWFLLVICLLILHLFPHRRAIWLTILMYGMSLFIVMWRIWRGLPDGDPSLTSAIMRIYLFGLVLVVCFFLLVRIRDSMRDLRMQHIMLEQLAYFDPLTGIHNRRHVGQVLQQEIQLAARYQQSFCVLLCDIDHFKQVNDRLGHAAGDAVLVTVSQRIAETVRVTDVIGRWGGEEFLVVMRHTACEEARLVAERICQAVVHPGMSVDAQVTLSIGIAQYQTADTNETVLQRADQALYAAKHAGRNQVVLAVAYHSFESETANSQ